MTRGSQPVLRPEDAAAFAGVKARVIARTGHHYYADKDDQLWERVAGRMAALGDRTVADYAARLDDAGAAGADEWARIESAVTINETFFFRFAEQFAALQGVVLPALIAARAGERQLRIWSVGCSTGAEPYSVAILLHRLLGDALPDWRVSVLGTDIDGDALAVAREGVFGRWALRGMAAAEREALFVAEGDRFRLKPRYRAAVRFERANMMALIADAPAFEGAAFDLILCRNVLIYFRQDVTVRMVAALAARLRPDGCLLLGHAEPNPGFDAVATPFDAGGVLAYRPPGVAATPVVVPAPAPAVEPPVAVAPVVPAAPRIVPRPVRVAPVAPPPDDPLPAIRTALSRGAAADALALAEGAAAAAPRDAAVQYLAGLAAAALGQAAAAERGYRRALYLDGGFAMAHYLLGRQYLGEGRTEAGRRSLNNAARAAAVLDDAAALPEGDGMTAGDMAAAVRHALAAAA